MFRSLKIISILLVFSCSSSTKDTIEVVDFDGLYSKIDLSVDKTDVINFWATWCAPCVKELPHFEEVNKELKDKNTEVILVSLDFPSQIESKLRPYLKDNNIQTEDYTLYDDDWFDYWDEFIQSHFDIVYPQIKRELFR